MVTRAQRILKEKDILFQTVRPYQGNNYYFEKAFELPAVASTGYAQIRTTQNSKFIYYALHTDGLKWTAINYTVKFYVDGELYKELSVAYGSILANYTYTTTQGSLSA